MPRHHILSRMAAALMPPLVLSGCLAPAGPREPTLADLDNAAAVEAAPVLLPAQPQASDQLQRALEVADQPQVRQQLREHIADMEMRSGETAQTVDQQDLILYRRAIAQYQAVLANRPPDPDNDRLHYRLAKAYELAGEPDNALASLEAVTRYCPSSPLCAEAHFRSGEILFSQQRYRQAKAAYGAAIAAGADTPFYRNAVYMRGWAQFKLAEYADALSSLGGIVDDLLADGRTPEQLTRADQELLEDSLRVLALISYSQDGAATIDEHFGAAGGRTYLPMLYTALADLYLDKQRFSDAASTYGFFLERYPDSDLALDFSLRIIAAYAQGGFPSLALAAKQRFVERYGITSRFWDASSAPARAPVLPHLHEYLRELAQSEHARAQALAKQAQPASKAAAPQAYRQAARWYGEFADTFPADPLVPEMTFLGAEALYESADRMAAIAAYERVAYEVRDEQRGAEAAYAAIVAYGELSAAAGPAEATEQLQRRMIDSIVRFAEFYPDDARVPTALAQASETLLALGAYTEAAELAGSTLGRLPPAATDAQLASRLVQGAALFELGDFRGAEQAYAAAMPLLPEGDQRRAPTRDRLAASVYQRAEQSLQAGDLAASAEQFQRIGAVAAGSDIAVQGQFDAAAILVQNQQWQEAEALLTRLQREFPDHPLAAGLPASLSEVYLQQQKWQPAADQLLRIARSSDDAQVREESLYMAATLYQRASQPDAAIGAFQQYIDQYPQQRDRVCEARYQIAEIHQQGGRAEERRRWLKPLLDDPQPAPTERCQYLAAAAAAVFADDAYQQFSGIRLKLPLKASLERKQAAMKQALTAYERLLGYGIEEFVTLATYRMGDVYRQLGQELLDSERPSRLTPLELEQYDLILEEQVYPFEEKAIALHEINAQRIPRGVYDEWVRRSLADLAALMPVRYGREERVIEFSKRLE